MGKIKKLQIVKGYIAEEKSFYLLLKQCQNEIQTKYLVLFSTLVGIIGFINLTIFLFDI